MVYVCLIYDLTQFHRYINQHTHTLNTSVLLFSSAGVKKKKKKKRPRYSLSLFLFPLTLLRL